MHDLPNSDADISRATAKPVPDLLGSFVVILISASITIFVFWASSQFLSQTTFQKLPEFLTNTFKAVWTSIAAGTAGIGLAIVRAVASRNQPQPNYLKYIGITTSLLIVAVMSLVVFTQRSSRGIPVPLLVPPNVVRIDPNSSGVKTFDLEDDPRIPFPFIKYALLGDFEVRGNTVIGHLRSGNIAVSQNAPHNFPELATHISFSVFYIHRVNGRDQLDSFPPNPKSEDSIDLDLKLFPGASYKLQPGVFQFDLPEGEVLDRAWLTAGIYTEVGNQYFPAR